MFKFHAKANVEIFCMAYGVFVTKLLRDAPNNAPATVNEELDHIGYKMGQRLIDEFLSRNEDGHKTYKNCKDFRQTMNAITNPAIQLFLGVSEGEPLWEEKYKQCSIIIKDNPLADYVILPAGYQNSLWYSNILCGMIRGSLEMVNVKVEATFVRDTLHGDQDTEIQVRLIEIMEDRYIEEDKKK